jgi:hypothetical protein
MLRSIPASLDGNAHSDGLQIVALEQARDGGFFHAGLALFGQGQCAATSNKPCRTSGLIQ